MAPSVPKVLLFDIGGVCVVSPFQAILDYEISQGIPPGYINATIQAGAPKGSWQLLERGEISLAGTFFDDFGAELSSPSHWKAYCENLSTKGGERGAYALKLLKERYGTQSDGKTPNIPPIDARKMFWNMMRLSRQPDPWVFPALLKLKASGKFVVAALSNTIDFPVGIKDENGTVFHTVMSENGESSGDIRSFFDAFVSSAHTGMRKPERRIYELALQECAKAAKEKGLSDNVQMSDILFLDDIGGNLKAAKQLGMQTLKVNLGRTKEAVQELEAITGLNLIDETPGSSKL